MSDRVHRIILSVWIELKDEYSDGAEQCLVSSYLTDLIKDDTRRSDVTRWMVTDIDVMYGDIVL